VNAEAVPGVQAAAVAMGLPTRVIGLRVPVRIEGVTTGGGSDIRAGAGTGAGARARGGAGGAAIAILRAVTPRYFETAGIPLTDGRAFTASDGEAAPGVAIVNAAFVRDILRGGPAVGVRLTADTMKGRLTIVGVVANVTPAGEADRPALYAPVDQVGIGGGSLLVRTDGNPATVVAALVARLRGVAPMLALDRIRIVADTIDAGHAVTRFNMRLASAFAGLALLLAAIGIYGLTAGEVSARWREVAVRLALGATRGEALWTVMRPGAAALAAGLVIGVAATLAVGRWMTSLLHGIAPADPPTLVIVPLLLGAMGVVAAAVAAARVLRADPAATLRSE
jgi:putative ABC transport system permease protein